MTIQELLDTYHDNVSGVFKDNNSNAINALRLRAFVLDCTKTFSAFSSYGPYTTIEEAELAIPLADRSRGQTVGIIEGDNIIEYWFEDEDLINLIRKDSGSYATVLDESLAVPTSVGGISSGTTVLQLKGKTFTQLFDDLLFPTLQATIGSNKSIVLNSSIGTSIVKVGSSVSTVLTASFGRGTITVTGYPNVPLVGNATEYQFSGTNIGVPVQQAGNSYSVPAFNAVEGSYDWVVSVLHDAGVDPYTDNKGNPATNLDAFRIAVATHGTFTDDSVNYQAIYPYFYGTSPTDPTLNEALVTGGTEVLAKSTGTITVNFNATTQFLWFAIPASAFSGTAKTKWYETALNNGNIGGGTNLFASAVTVAITDTFGSPQNYLVYKSNYATSVNTLELRN